MKQTLIILLAVVLFSCKDDKLVSNEPDKDGSITIKIIDSCEYIAYYSQSLIHKENCKNCHPCRKGYITIDSTYTITQP